MRASLTEPQHDAIHCLTRRPDGAVSCDKVASPTGSDTASGHRLDPLPDRSASDRRPGSRTGGVPPRRQLYAGRSDQRARRDADRLLRRDREAHRAALRHRQRGRASRFLTSTWTAGRAPTRASRARRVERRQHHLQRQRRHEHAGNLFQHRQREPDVGAARTTWSSRTNRIHHCGNLPPTNHDHGIYVEASDNLVIRNNVIDHRRGPGHPALSRRGRHDHHEQRHRRQRSRGSSLGRVRRRRLPAVRKQSRGAQPDHRLRRPLQRRTSYYRPWRSSGTGTSSRTTASTQLQGELWQRRMAAKTGHFGPAGRLHRDGKPEHRAELLEPGREGDYSFPAAIPLTPTSPTATMSAPRTTGSVRRRVRVRECC